MLAAIESNLDDLAQLWLQAPELMQKEHAKAVTEAGLFLEAELKENSPVGSTGFYRQAHTFAGPIVLGDDVEGVVGNPLIYAPGVELGTKPHMPPVTPLIDWVETVLDLNGAQAQSVAWAIAMKIKKKGTKGQFVYKRTFDMSAPALATILIDATTRVKEKLHGAS